MPWRIQLKIRQNAGQICQISVSDQLKVVRNLDWQLFLCVARPRSDTEKKLQSGAAVLRADKEQAEQEGQ
eukprot:COSAG06_NODE_315_length_17722_cov_10.903535_5_plen_70_part_00